MEEGYHCSGQKVFTKLTVYESFIYPISRNIGGH